MSDDLEAMPSGTYRYDTNASSFPTGKVGDDLIKRWRMDCGAGSDGSVWADAEPDDEGDFVRYDDHAAALAEAQAEIARLTARADRMEAALRDIVRLSPRSGAAWVARAALTDKPDAGAG